MLGPKTLETSITLVTRNLKTYLILNGVYYILIGMNAMIVVKMDVHEVARILCVPRLHHLRTEALHGYTHNAQYLQPYEYHSGNIVATFHDIYAHNDDPVVPNTERHDTTTGKSQLATLHHSIQQAVYFWSLFVP